MHGHHSPSCNSSSSWYCSVCKTFIECSSPHNCEGEWLRTSSCTFKCWIGMWPNQYPLLYHQSELSTCDPISTLQSHAHITPLLYHQSEPSTWPMVIFGQSLVSVEFWVLSKILAQIPQESSLVVVPQCTGWHIYNLLDSGTLQVLLCAKERKVLPSALFVMVLYYVCAKSEPI